MKTKKEARILKKTFDAIEKGKKIRVEFSEGRILLPDETGTMSSCMLQIGDKIYDLSKFENADEIIEKIKKRTLEVEFDVIDKAMVELGYEYEIGASQEKTYELDNENIIVNAPDVVDEVLIHRTGRRWERANVGQKTWGWNFKLPKKSELKKLVTADLCFLTRQKHSVNFW